MATAPHAILPLSKLCPQVTEWVESVRNLTQPAAVHWCEGSAQEIARLTQQLQESGELSELNGRPFRAVTWPVPIRPMWRGSNT